MIKVGLRSGGVITISKDEVDVSQLTLDDIAYGLANTQRFSGQLDRPYSVAEHSVILSDITAPLDYEQRIAALFHDAPETLGIGDVNCFLKPKELQKIEDRILAAVLTKFGVQKYKYPDLDRELGWYEATHIHPAKGNWERKPFAHPVHFRHWHRTDAAYHWRGRLEVYKRTLEFQKAGIDLSQVKPDSILSIDSVADRFPGVDRIAVVDAVRKHPLVVEGKVRVQ